MYTIFSLFFSLLFIINAKKGVIRNAIINTTRPCLSLIWGMDSWLNGTERVSCLNFIAFRSQYDEKSGYWFLEEIRFNPPNDQFAKIQALFKAPQRRQRLHLIPFESLRSNYLTDVYIYIYIRVSWSLYSWWLGESEIDRGSETKSASLRKSTRKRLGYEK